MSGKKKFVVVVLVFAIGIASMIFYIWQRYEAVNLGYNIQALNKKIGSLNLKINELRLKKNRLRSPKRIERIAKQELGMIIPKEKDVVIISLD